MTSEVSPTKMPKAPSQPGNRRRGRKEPGGGERPQAPPLRTAFLAWLVPGLGHWLLGFRVRAALFAVLVLGSLVFGIVLDGKMPWTWGLDQSPLFLLATLGAVGSGGPYFLARLVLGFEGDPTGWAYDYGGAFVLTAGLMNLLLVLDAWDLCHGKEELILEAEAAEEEDGEKDGDKDAAEEDAEV